MAAVRWSACRLLGVVQYSERIAVRPANAVSMGCMRCVGTTKKFEDGGALMMGAHNASPGFDLALCVACVEGVDDEPDARRDQIVELGNDCSKPALVLARFAVDCN